MAEHPRDLALLALALLHGDAATSEQAVESDQLAEGQAYLNGVAIQALAHALNVPVDEAVDYLRRLLTDGGDPAGVREPRRPRSPLPSLAVEREVPEGE